MSEAIVNDLCRAAKRGDHHAVLTLFAKLPADARTPDILAARLVALTQAGKWDDLIAATEGAPAHAFLRAYAFYKQDRFDKTLETLSSVRVGVSVGVSEDTHTQVLHLRGQALYRLGRYAEAAAVYQDILKQLTEEGADDADVDDVRVSLLAALVANGTSASVLSDKGFAGMVDNIARGRGTKTGAPYELLYNVACALIDAGQPAAAMRALAAAYVSGEEALSADGADLEQVADDLAIIRAQAAYLLQQAHYDDAAAALYHNVLALTPRITDVSVAPVIASNLAQIKSTGRDVVEAYKRLRVLTSNLAGNKLVRGQLFSVHFNRAVVALLMRRFDDARAALVDVQEQLSQLPSSLASRAHAGAAAAVLGAAISAGPAGSASGDYRSALEHTSSGLTGVAARAQLLIDSGSLVEAGQLLLQHAPKPMHPAVAASAAQLLVAGDRVDDGLAALNAAVSAWEGDAGHRSNLIAVRLIRAAALTHRGDRVAASADYEAILALPDASGDSKAAAAAALAILLVEGAASSTAEDATATVRRADELVRESTSLAVGMGGRRPSFADVSKFTAEAMDKLEWSAAAETVGPTQAAASAAVAAGGATGAKATPAASGAPEASREAARKAAKHRRVMKQRAKRRERYLERLKTTGAFGLLGIPRPDPERWLPKRERTYGKKSRARKIASRMNVSSGGAQGAMSGAMADMLTRELDAKAKADAAKAREAARGGSAGAAAAAPAPAPVPPPGVGKRKGKGRK